MILGGQAEVDRRTINWSIGFGSDRERWAVSRGSAALHSSWVLRRGRDRAVAPQPAKRPAVTTRRSAVAS